MDLNPYNRNKISNTDYFQQKKEKINETKNLIFGNPMRYSYSKYNNSKYNLYNKGNDNSIENTKGSHKFHENIQNQFTSNQFNSFSNNIRYLIYIPIPMNQHYPTYSIINHNNISNSQKTVLPNSINTQKNRLIDNYIDDFSFFGLESKKKEEQRLIKKQEYREELLKQIEEKKKADEERNKRMKEEEKNEIKQNEEYFKLKKAQAEEQARKLREKIARRMQRQQAEEFANPSHILEISKDFENMNKSRQGTSVMNNIELTGNKNSIESGNRNSLINIEENYENENFFNLVNNNMILEQENYMKEIDNEYNELYQSLTTDIDKMINNKNIDISFSIPEYNSKLTKKEKQYADYILGKTLSPPTPFKFENNPLSYSYSQKRREKDNRINLDDFFNNDEESRYYKDKKYNSKKKEITNKINKDYFEIFEILKDTNSYTKKYSKEPDSYSHSESFITNKSHTSFNDNKSNNDAKNKNSLASYYNSSVSNTMYDKDNIKNENDEDNMVKIEDLSMRTTENKNKSKTLLDKKLINIKENKEDEEDEEDDDENKKIKEEKKSENVNNNYKEGENEANIKDNEINENHLNEVENKDENEEEEEEEDDEGKDE